MRHSSLKSPECKQGTSHVFVDTIQNIDSISESVMFKAKLDATNTVCIQNELVDHKHSFI
jgi:hypothetical protein